MNRILRYIFISSFIILFLNPLSSLAERENEKKLHDSNFYIGGGYFAPVNLYINFQEGFRKTKGSNLSVEFNVRAFSNFYWYINTSMFKQSVVNNIDELDIPFDINEIDVRVSKIENKGFIVLSGFQYKLILVRDQLNIMGGLGFGINYFLQEHNEGKLHNGVVSYTEEKSNEYSLDFTSELNVNVNYDLWASKFSIGPQFKLIFSGVGGLDTSFFIGARAGYRFNKREKSIANE